jgi:hypothetical protein
MIVRFTIGASGRQGIRTLIPLEGETALAERPGEPYPATFRSGVQWTHRESNPGLRRAMAVPFR